MFRNLGYALLAELSALLEGVEAAILQLPGQLGNDSRCKPALDELQALLASVSQYQSECEDARRHLEAALSELAEGCAPAEQQPTYAIDVPACAPDQSTDQSAAVGAPASGLPPEVPWRLGPESDAALLLRVRQAVCSLDLDVEMMESEQDPSLDAELLQLREQMRRELQQQRGELQGDSAQGSQLAAACQLGLGQGRGHAHGAAAAQVDSEDGLQPEDPAPPATARAGSRRTRDGPGGPEEEIEGRQGGATGSAAATAGGRVARLYAVRAVTRRLAAQQLATLKEQQKRRQEQPQQQGIAFVALGDVDGGSATHELPATRRRRVLDSADATPSGSSAAAMALGSSAAAMALGSSSVSGSDTGLTGASRSITAGAGTAARRRHGGSEDGSGSDGPLQRQLSVEAGGLSGGGSGLASGGDASMAALRRLNRVTQLAGMWEAGRPVAQQATAAEAAAAAAAAEAAGGSGSDSDVETEGAVAGGRSHTARLAGLSPFLLLALQGRAGQAPPPPVLGRLLAPQEPGPNACPEVAPAAPAEAPASQDEELPAPPAAAALRGPDGSDAGHRGRGGGRGSDGGSPRASPTAAAAAAAALAHPLAPAPQHRAAPAPLPLPDASVHLRAVGLPGLPAPLVHWHLQGPFGPPGLGLGFGVAAAGGGAGDAGGVTAPPACSLLDLGPDVPTIDLQKDITGWGACLGRGAFGCVYKAMYRNKPVAVKLLHGGGGLESRDLRCLRSEIRLLCRLRPHPNIITVYGAAASPPDAIALVTELMDCDLYDYIHRRRQNCVPLDEVLAIARAIASGLSELHPAVVHRDLKPANVLLRLTGHAGPPAVAAAAAQQQQVAAAAERRLVVKIADFGLARHKRSQYLSTRERDAGTLKYMAPECIASSGSRGGGDGEGGGGGGGVTEKCDIYSFGVLLYELITGREPWEGCHPLYAVCQVQSGATLPLPDDPGRCPPALRSLVARCWASSHSQRPSSRQLVAELDGLIAQHQRAEAAAALGETAGAAAAVTVAGGAACGAGLCAGAAGALAGHPPGAAAPAVLWQ
ncbi:hypothetical protein GPECTOR_47g331 [Gonium pectorale]|uniref:Protein kinase domain-containing protein n=1 Tax=Gonium pectorale TaxID=33097 RepID=A0A150G866_GONPE|nr:hypothetical protein GPECTOR_47g331 [Gonium pectorale]|eukprot:KXZ46056.1 hypothetical protein GPECTOR_47g331 [Gonium pectorale]